MIPGQRSAAATMRSSRRAATNRRLGLDVLRVIDRARRGRCRRSTCSLVRPTSSPATRRASALALLAMAFGVGLRFGSVPFHVHAIQLLEGRDRLALPLLTLVWGPALFGLVALAAVRGRRGALRACPCPPNAVSSPGLPCSRSPRGIAGALLQDDIDHLVAWSIVRTRRFVLLAFAAADAASWGSARAWLADPRDRQVGPPGVGARGRPHVRDALVVELRGWARRAPAAGGRAGAHRPGDRRRAGLRCVRRAARPAAQALRRPDQDGRLRRLVRSVVIVRCGCWSWASSGRRQVVSASPGEAFRRPPAGPAASDRRRPPRCCSTSIARRSRPCSCSRWPLLGLGVGARAVRPSRRGGGRRAGRRCLGAEPTSAPDRRSSRCRRSSPPPDASAAPTDSRTSDRRVGDRSHPPAPASRRRARPRAG